MAPSTERSPGAGWRVWPGVAAALALLVLRYIVPAMAPEGAVFGVDAGMIAMFGGLICAAAILVWWLFFSRASWSERLGVLAVMIVAAVATRPLTHISIQNGMMGMMFALYAAPATLALALVGWAVASRRLSRGMSRVALVVAVLAGCGVWTLMRTEGLLGGMPEMAWRWTPTAEERLLAQEAGREPPAIATPPAPADAGMTPVPPAASTPPPAAPAAPDPAAPTATAASSPNRGATLEGPDSKPASAAAPARLTRAEERGAWNGFRGPARDGVVRGLHIDTGWGRSAPVELWRRPVGPGWSSFAVRGDYIYTQEQRGDDEVVSCYRLSTGEPVWRHRNAVRFWESNAGAGPRATPTVDAGRVYAMGATGLLNALDADTGAVLWSRNAAIDTAKTVPDWGIASSPLAIDDLVIVAVAGQLAAYDARTGEPRWLGEAGGGGYSSPHLATIDGVPQVLLARGARTISVAPASGALLWEHSTGQAGVSIVQPALAGGDVLVAGGDAMGGSGIRRVAVTHGTAGWTVEERWHSRGLKPYFSDFVVHEGYAFGFDGSILSAIDLSDGTRKWKGGRYGSGQMLLLPEQDVLLVVSEEGELALVSATADRFTEIARVPALNSKTWNHPVIVGDVLLVRNGEEMAAFRLPAASRTTR